MICKRILNNRRFLILYKMKYMNYHSSKYLNHTIKTETTNENNPSIHHHQHHHEHNYEKKVEIEKEKNVSPIPEKPKSYYRRPFPETLISFTSEYGKMLFKEALEEGGLEAYFPLADQLITQAEPSACGASTLTMILNALSLDPNKVWKGIWRWFSEENLSCSPPELLKGINLDQYNHLASCNGASVQCFLYPSLDYRSIPTNPADTRFITSTKTVHDSEICPTDLKLKYAKYTTFKSCLIASTRRVGFFMVINCSRKALGQTGMGHYCPVAGSNLKREYALILEVARFKYPSFWASFKTLYDSMKDVDKLTNTSRGFSLVTRDFRAFSEICRISEDAISIDKLKKYMEHEMPKAMEITYTQSQNLPNKQAREIKMIFDFFVNLPDDFQYLMAYYLFDLSVRLEYKPKKSDVDTNNVGENLYSRWLEHIEKIKLTEFVQKFIDFYRVELENYPLFTLISDFQPVLGAQILTMILLALPRTYIEQGRMEFLYDLCLDKEKQIGELGNELNKLKRVLGWIEKIKTQLTFEHKEIN